MGIDMFPVCVLAVVGGYLLHVAAPLFEHLPPRIAQLARYASGSTCTYPFVLALLSIYLEISWLELIAPVTAAYFLAFLFFGSGVFLGYWTDRYQDHQPAIDTEEADE